MLQRIKPLPALALAASLLTVLAMAESAAAQNIQNPQSAVDSLTRSGMRIDPSTGALQMQIPLGEYRGRGEASLPVVLNYSSKLWNIKYISTAACSGEPVSAYRGDYSKGSASGWTSTLGWFLPPQDVTLETYEGLYQKPAQRGDPTLWRIARMYVTLPDGSRHELRRDDSLHSTTEDLTGVYYAVDGSRLWYDKGTDTLYLPNGARYLSVIGGAVQYVDRNGNTLSYDSSSGVWSDTLGRSIGVPVPGAAPAVGNYSFSLPGVNGSTVTYQMHWSNLGDALTDPSQPLHYIGDSLSANCTTGNHQPNNLFSTIEDQNKVMQGGIFNPVVLSQIVLPNGASYTFTYNVYGEIDKIVYPTGGAEQFGYAMLAPLGGQLDDGTYSQANRGVFSRVISDGNTTQTWQYNSAGFETGVDPLTAQRSVTAPDGTVTKTWYYISRGTDIHYGFDDARTGMAREERVYNSAGTMIRRTLFQLAEDGPQSGGYSTATRNARVTKKVDIILDTGGNALAAATEMTYDSDFNVIVTKHYDYASIAQTTAQTADIPSIANGTLLRSEETDYLTGDANYRARNLLSLPTAARVKDGAGNIVAQSSTAYDETALQNIGSANGWIDPQTSYRGNPTTSSHWLNTTNSYLSTHANYDQFGNVRTTTDAKGNQSQIDYSGTYSYAYPTTVTSAIPDPTGQHGSTTALVTSSVYDLNTGLSTSATDANGITTTFTYSDVFDRLTRTVRASGNAVQSQTTIAYDDPNRTITTTSDQAAYNDNALKSQVLYDALGRTIESRQYEGGTNYIATQTQYDVMGRAYKTSNPFRPWQSETAFWTTSAFDALGRVVSVTTPDSAAVTSSYSGNTVTVTDQAGKQRQSVTDGLGRLTAVYEDPSGLNYLTSYSYDTLDNLTTVSQGGQTRAFVYDSLKRLALATNPESGAVSYAYDPNGNLTSKTDARSITTTYTYDALNRAVTRSYSDGTPTVTYTYDAASVANSKGRLTSVSSSVSTTNYTAYDALGRITSSNQITDGQTYSMSYGYDLAGGQTSITYPTGRVITSEYDAAEKLAGVRDQQSGVYYAGAASTDTNRMQYAAHGAVSVMKLGNGLWEHTSFNNRLQPTQIGLGTSSTDSSTMGLSYNYGTTNNNGNLQSVSYSGGGLSYTQNFGYDTLNRLTTSNENSGSSWSQTNGYDQYGNRWIDYGGGVHNLGFSTTTNRITTSGYAYDAAGNLANDSIHSYGFDAENKITTVDGVTGVYGYDGDGNRVRKNFALGEQVRMVYSGGQLIAEYDLSSGTLKKEYVYAAKGLVATIEPSTGTSYTTSDHLGSPRVVTNSTAGVVSRHDYMPFGEEIGVTIGGRTSGMGYGVADSERQKFTLKERDNETGLDYFGARYFASTQGRFTSPDPVAGSCWNPQSLNAYAYAWNNPMKLTDPSGMVVSWEDSEAKKKKNETEARTDAQRKYENHIKGMLNSKDAKTRAEGQKLQAQYERLQKSDITFHVVKENPTDASSGELTYAGHPGDLYVNLKGNSSEYGALTDVQKLAHEFTHGEQFLDSKLGFAQNAKTGKWEGYRDDLVDEAEAFIAGFDAQPLDPGQRSNKFLNAVESARSFGVKAVADVLAREGPYVKYPRNETPITNVTPTIYAVPRNK